jgi:integrase
MVGNPLPTSFLAGDELKTIADQLGHSSVVLTADTYLNSQELHQAGVFLLVA